MALGSHTLPAEHAGPRLGLRGLRRDQAHWQARGLLVLRGGAARGRPRGQNVRSPHPRLPFMLDVPSGHDVGLPLTGQLGGWSDDVEPGPRWLSRGPEDGPLGVASIVSSRHGPLSRWGAR